MTGPLVVIGDALLDVDLQGTADRLSPDAPVPVVDTLAEIDRPGGAALAAALAAADGAEVVLVCAIADDEGGARLRAALAGRVRLVELPLHGATPVKRRVRVDGHSVVRLDSGGAPAPSGELTGEVRTAVAAAGAVLVSDYGRGLTSRPDLRRLLAGAHAPTVWDPHPRGAVPLPGSRLVTPNAAEAARAVGAEAARAVGAEAARAVGAEAARAVAAEAARVVAGLAQPSAAAPQNPLAVAGAHAHALVHSWAVGAVAVTLGRRGALLSYGEGAPLVVPAPDVDGGDPCGAGDRFAAAAAVLLAAGAVPTEAVAGAVAAASAFVARGGASQWDAADRPAPARPGRPVAELLAGVRSRGGTVVATGGCFDLLHAGHVATLRAARSLGDCLVVCINSDASVRRLKGPERPLVPAEDRARVLEALGCVDAVVVFEDDTPERVIDRLRPDVWAKGGDYAGVDLPEATLMRRWGGQAVVLPYLDGRSTTALVARATELTSRSGG